MGKGKSKGIGLSAAIELLRRELTDAIETGNRERERMRFRLDEPIVLEINAVLAKSGQGSLGWRVIQVGGSVESTDTHKITVRLNPEWWDGAKYDSEFLVSESLPDQLASTSGLEEDDRRSSRGQDQPNLEAGCGSTDMQWDEGIEDG